MYSNPYKFTIQNNQNYHPKNKLKSSQIEIEYEKISEKENPQLNQVNENDNFNVYFMKPDFKYKTISSTNSLTNSRVKKINLKKDEQKNEKEFKSHLIQKLKNLKLNQNNKDKIHLNIASKIRREESIRNSLKYLLSKQTQFDPKKELIYYKAYFRIWKRKCKNENDNYHKKIMKKDKNIRITTVIYRADKPKKFINNKIIEEKKNDKKEKNEFFRKKLIRFMESKSKDKKIKNQNKEKNGNNFIQNESKKNSINKNTQVYTSNIKTIKNSIKDENKFEINKNKIYSQNQKYELSNSRKEALNKINKNIKKEFKFEGFNGLKKFRNKSREKEGTEKLNNIFLKKNTVYKEEALKKIKQNIINLKEKDNINNIEIIHNFNIEGEKWTVNKFNWQIEEISKDKDSLYGLSGDELKESNNYDENIKISQKNFSNNFSFNNQYTNSNNNISNNDNNFSNNNNNSKDINNINNPLYKENVDEPENVEEEEEYEIISKGHINYENNEFNNENEEENIENMNYEEIDINNLQNNEENVEEEYNNNDGNEEYNYEEENGEYNNEEGDKEENYEVNNIGDVYIDDDNQMEEEMVEEYDNYTENEGENGGENGLEYLKDEVEEMLDENGEEYQDPNNENENLQN